MFNLTSLSHFSKYWWKILEFLLQHTGPFLALIQKSMVLCKLLHISLIKKEKKWEIWKITFVWSSKKRFFSFFFQFFSFIQSKNHFNFFPFFIIQWIIFILICHFSFIKVSSDIKMGIYNIINSNLSFLLSEPNYFTQFAMRHPTQNTANPKKNQNPKIVIFQVLSPHFRVQR